MLAHRFRLAIPVRAPLFAGLLLCASPTLAVESVESSLQNTFRSSRMTLAERSAGAHDAGAVLLRRAAHCLATKGFLPETTASRLTFGFLVDEKSYPDERVLYVVNYPDPARRDGFVFAIFLAEHEGRQSFDIQNNARFALSKAGYEGVSFLDPPLGGSWTQQHLVFAIRQIEKQPVLTISTNGLLADDPRVRCQAYTDP